MRRIFALVTALAAMALFPACNLLQPSGSPAPAEATTEDTQIPTPTAEVAGTLPSTEEGPPALTPQPPAPVLTSIWPLSSDLFYLNDAGQVWRQLLSGDESAAAVVTRLDLSVLDFAVAPGGGWLLYRTADTVAVSSLDGTSGQLLAQTGEPAGRQERGHTVAWSPDGIRLAYATADGFQVFIAGGGSDFEPLIYSAPESPLIDLGWSRDSQWLLVQRVDGSAALYSAEPTLSLWVELGRVNSYVWLSDGRLAFAPAEGGLALLYPANLDSRTFMVPQDRQIDLLCQRSDGMLAFFVHPDGLEGPGYLNTGNPLDASFRQEGTAPIHTSGLVWDSIGARLIGQGEEPSTAMLIDPASGARATFQTAGTPVSFVWAETPPQEVTGVSLPADLYFLAPQAGIVQVWRLPRTGGPPQAITNATSDVTAYDISADGTQVTYTSGGAIYRLVIGTLDQTEIATLSGTGWSSTGMPAFSPTGRRIAYADGGIWVYDLETAQSRRLVADTLPQNDSDRQVVIYDQPRWSPDGEWLLVTVRFYEGADQALLSTAGSPPQPVFLNLYNTRGRWIAEELAIVYSEGGAYSAPQVSMVGASTSPNITRLADLPVVDVRARSDGQLVLLRVPSPSPVGPTSVRLYSVAQDGTNLQPEGGAFVLEEPVLSPEGLAIAGLVQARWNEFGVLSGRLAIANPLTGETVVIAGVLEAHDLQWGAPR
jgi:Tol biopolymer transport system component